MKMIELKCIACSGTLKLDGSNPNTTVYECRHTEHVIEDAGSDRVWLGTPPPSQYASQNSGSSSPRTFDSFGGKKAIGWEPHGWEQGTALVCIGLVPVSAINAKGLIRRWNMDRPEKSGIMINLRAVEVTGEEEKGFSSIPGIPSTGAFAMMAEATYGKPAGEIIPQELEKFQWLTTKYMDMGSVLAVGYSYDDPYTPDTASLTWVPLSRNAAKLDTSQLAQFTELGKLDLSGSISSGDLSGLPIQGISCYSDSPVELTECLGDAAVQLKEVNITASPESLDGITVFTGAEKVSVYGGRLTGIAILANLKNVTPLTLDYCGDATDFSVLSVIPWLKEFSIEPEGLRDIGFVSRMSEPTSPTLENTSILYVDGLEDNTTLTSPSTDRCGEMKDCGAISGLAGLQKLFLDIPYGCTEPDLDRLTGLIELTVSRFDSTDFPQNMPQLTTLTLDGCQISDTGAFAGLTGLRELSCSHVYGNLADWNFVGGIPGLEVLDLSGVSAREGVFSLPLTPTLQELYLNGMECELNFSRLVASESLTTSEMDGVEFYTNTKIPGGGGICSTDYDKMSLDEHTNFLTDHPSLENLSLADNTLTSVDFTSSLGALETLNISGSYVTDLKPFETLKAPKMVDNTDNPIRNYRVLGDDVLTLK